MTRKLLTRIVTDYGLVPDALRLVLYVEGLGAGWHRIKQPALRMLLNGRGEKPIRNARENAVECRWLAWVDGGRAGDCFRLRTPEEAAEETAAFLEELGRSLNASQMGGISEINPSPQGVISEKNPSHLGGISAGNDAQTGGISGIGRNPSQMGGISETPHARVPYREDTNTTTTPPPPTPTARAGDPEMKRLRDYLGPHAGALNRFDTSAEHTITWPGAIWGDYGPGGCDLLVWRGVKAEGRPPRLAKAISDYATKSKPFDSKYFRGFLLDTIRTFDPEAGDNERNSAAVQTNKRNGTKPHGTDPDRAAALASLS